MARPLVVIAGRRSAHELLFLVVSLVVGIAYTIGSPPPTSVAALMPGWALHIWSAGLTLSGVLGLAGLLLRRSWALQVEQAGMLIGAAALVWYTASVVPFGWKALLAGCISVAWALANVVTALQIRHDLRGH